MTRAAKAAVVLLITVWSHVAEPAVVPYRIDRDKTLFLAVTHPAGTMVRLGHDHLFSATSYDATLVVDEEQLSRSHFLLKAPLADLAVDDPEAIAAALPRLRTLGIVDKAFPRLSPEERKTTLERMASPSQLDAARNPIVLAKVETLQRASASTGQYHFPWTLGLALTLRGKTVTREIPANIVLRDGYLTANVLGQFRFSEFGIRPFQTALGLLRNQDAFDIYVELGAFRERP